MPHAVWEAELALGRKYDKFVAGAGAQRNHTTEERFHKVVGDFMVQTSLVSLDGFQVIEEWMQKIRELIFFIDIKQTK